MKFNFITIFPNLMQAYFSDSILARAVNQKIIEINFINPRDFTKDRYKKVDDYMIGGGAGLLMQVEPLELATKSIKEKTHIIYLTPNGKLFKQNDAKRLAKFDSITLVCGRYEGVDERYIERNVDEVFCLGDFILTGGELGALCIADAVSRNLDGVLGNKDSLVEESFEKEFLEAPNFTKPNVFENNLVVSEFLKGNHDKILALKNSMSKLRTKYYRPDLYHQRKNHEK
ncbi:MAG: tRNA (guanosine(37)-N1)-methyltransferase TrmD [Campylobacter sp.]|nr:tRNA (guanosine(37)-N1)-methyltransferase TrmD [Campylobacter sp.]